MISDEDRSDLHVHWVLWVSGAVFMSSPWWGSVLFELTPDRVWMLRCVACMSAGYFGRCLYEVAVLYGGE